MGAILAQSSRMAAQNNELIDSTTQEEDMKRWVSAVVDNMTTAVVVLDEALQVEYLNSAAEDLLKMSISHAETAHSRVDLAGRSYSQRA